MKKLHIGLIVILFLLGLILFLTHERYYKTQSTLRIVNEQLDCEEQNLHYRVIASLNEIPVEKTPDIILPVLNSEIATEENYALMWPALPKARIELIVKGHYSTSEHKNWSDGCKGAHKFKIIEIVSWKDITNDRDFPINNKVN